MIPTEKAQQYLNSKPKITLTEASFSAFSKPYKTLGLIITMLCNTKQNYRFNFSALYTEAFGTDASVNPWESKEGLQLAGVLFGIIRAPYIKEIWSLLDTLPYQTGHNRRSFRRKPDALFIAKKITDLQNLYHSGSQQGFSTLSFAEQIQYNTYSQYHTHAYLFAIILDKKDAALDTLVDDIINAEDEIGGVTRPLIKALLLSNRPENWEKVGKLLLAAQRQEGLRQTILECLDETQIGALQYLTKLILEHDLYRFSSVIRAVDTWFGFGWHATKKATIKRVLELAHQFLETPRNIENAIDSKDSIEVYVALWAQGVRDVTVANQLAFTILYNTQEKHRKLLALFFIYETVRTQANLKDFIETELGKDVEIDYWLLQNRPHFTWTDAIFDTIKATAAKIPNDGLVCVESVFSWKTYIIEAYYFYDLLIKNASDSQLQSLAANISDIPSRVREEFMRKLFPKHYTYSWNRSFATEKIPLESKDLGWKRQVIHQAIQDRNQSVMATGVRLFHSIHLESADIEVVENLLQRKNKDLRKSLIHLLSHQPEKIIKNSTQNLIHSSKIEQRLAGLELLTVLDEKETYAPFIASHLATYKERSSISKNEQVFLDKFETENTNEFNFANGFGAINYDNLSPLIVPQQKFETKKGLLGGLLGKKERLITRFIDEEKTVKQCNILLQLMAQHKDYEYQFEGYQGETVTTLLSKQIAPLKKLENPTPQERLENLPLASVWMDWQKASKLNDYELEALVSYFRNNQNLFGHYLTLKPFLEHYVPNFKGISLSGDYYSKYASVFQIKMLLESIQNATVDAKTLKSYKLDLLEDAIACFPENLKNTNLDTNQWRKNDVFWCDVLLAIPYFTSYTNNLNKRKWQLTNYMMAQSLAHPKTVSQLKEVLVKAPKKVQFPCTSEYVTIPLYHKGEATKDDLLLEMLLSNANYQGYTLDRKEAKNIHKFIADLNPPYGLSDQLKENLLSIELERGELETEATNYITKFQNFKGIDVFITILERLGKANFDRGYSYNNTSKSTIFSSIIRKSIPAENETYEDFVSKIKATKIPKKRLIETACYATKWANWIGRYLGMDALEDGVWWFHAHSSGYMNAQKETLISRYSDMPIHVFKMGGLDIEWFHTVYKNLGKTNWKLLHESAKYISDGMAHKRVKLYSGVLLNEVKITETLKKIKDKRDKDYVRALGLIPLSKTNPEGDLLKRYNLLQTFLKESKQFGAQRQESEKEAVEIGLENLSRNAGYRDSIRFGWAMEAKAAQEIMENSVVTIDDVTVSLVINNQGKAKITIEKKGKSQKTIPAKLKKNKDIIRLKEDKAYLVKQYARTRLSLENAMLNEDAFAKAELENIMLHPIVKPMLSKLVLYIKEKQYAGFWKEGYMIDTDAKTHLVTEEDQLIIAHPSHLHQALQWDLFQRYLFENSIVQPFKQVYRELYLVTENERETSNRSERYQGHQIQPKKTIALLRGRGWTVSNDEGLQKVYHKLGFMATLYAMADWYSPADIEAPTLEYVVFTNLKDHKSIPMATINPLIFSEVMRDVDLVVSVAHVGGVDPEASHSTLEMRAVLARESARLFKLTNIEVKERHILIKGKLGDYSIHLGSGNVSKDRLFLSIIPVHSQHRGRLFLPFVDDDPKSAEIISKMKLLAEDDKIQDPTVLAQIHR